MDRYERRLKAVSELLFSKRGRNDQREDPTQFEQEAKAIIRAVDEADEMISDGDEPNSG